MVGFPSVATPAPVVQPPAVDTPGAVAESDLFAALIQVLTAMGDASASIPLSAPVVTGDQPAEGTGPAFARALAAVAELPVTPNVFGIRSGAANADRSKEKAAATPTRPQRDDSRTVPVAIPVSPDVPITLFTPTAATEDTAPVSAEAADTDPKPVERLRVDAPVIEVRIKEPVESASVPAPSKLVPIAHPEERPSLPERAASRPVNPTALVSAQPVQSTVPVLAETAALAHPRNTGQIHTEQVEYVAPKLPEPPPTTPLRSFALEFTPDGARDVKLRVTERSGEVHVSVHSTDPALTGVLKEGVHDLAGALIHAGYDAEAWSSGSQQQQQQRQEQDERQHRRAPRRSDEHYSEPFDIGAAGDGGSFQS